MKPFLIALQFLTIFPFKLRGQTKESDYGKSLFYFPIIGMIIGSILALILLACGPLALPVTGVIILITSAIITGALHLDGFADTCDGFYGIRSKEEVLAIMRDPHIGAMGALGLILLLLLKFSLIISIPKPYLWQALIFMCVFSRWSQAVACLLPYMRTEGKAGLFTKYASRQGIIFAAIFTLFISYILFSLAGTLIFFSSLVFVLLFTAYAKAKIGGMTGDTIGAVNEIGEASVLFNVFILTTLWN